MIEWLALIGIGLSAGLLSGLLGIGGGLVIVPGLIWLLGSLGMSVELSTHVAAVTSLSLMMLTASVAAWQHHRHRQVDWAICRRLAPCVMIGVVLGALLSLQLQGHWLRLLLAIVVLWNAFRLLRKNQPQLTTVCSSRFLAIASLGIGTLSGLLGVGGGFLLVPLLGFFGLALPRAIGTSSALIMPISIIGTLTFIMAGNSPSLPFVWHWIYWPGALVIALASLMTIGVGVHLTQALPIKVLRKIFAVFLIVIAVEFLESVW